MLASTCLLIGGGHMGFGFEKTHEAFTLSVWWASMRIYENSDLELLSSSIWESLGMFWYVIYVFVCVYMYVCMYVHVCAHAQL